MNLTWSLDDAILVPGGPAGRPAAAVTGWSVDRLAQPLRRLLLAVVLLHLTLAGYFCAHWCEVRASLLAPGAASALGHHHDGTVASADAAGGSGQAFCHAAPDQWSVSPVLDMFFPAFDVTAGLWLNTGVVVALAGLIARLRVRTRRLAPPEAPPRFAR